MILTLFMIASFFIYLCDLTLSHQFNVCFGTNVTNSVPPLEIHYRNLRDRYTNCTYVEGNLELAWMAKPMNLSFLQHIREVSGYVFIYAGSIKHFVLPALQIIHGRTLFKWPSMERSSALIVMFSGSYTLGLPALREILNGSVTFKDNHKLCHMRSINWDAIITGPNETFYTDNSTIAEKNCPSCPPTCKAGCWHSGFCQKFSETNCSAECGGRCFGPKEGNCCHLFCVGGCTGPTQRHCLACRNFNDEGVCKEECPPMLKYNPTKYLWEPNPDGKYAFGGTCVRNCPTHTHKNAGECVRDFNCSDECTEGGCWGPGPEQCLECKNFNFSGICLNSCESLPNIYTLDSKNCAMCHPECRKLCTGQGPAKCSECVMDENICVSKCPEFKFNLNGTCLKRNESCPDGFYHVKVKHGVQCQDECPSDYNTDEMRNECFACDGNCRGCTGPGPSNCIHCQQVKLYSNDHPNNDTAFHCMDKCPPSHRNYNDAQLGRYCIAEDDTSFTYIYVLLVMLFVIVVLASILFYYCNEWCKHSKEVVMTTQILSEELVPLHLSNVGPNLTRLRIIKEQELRRGSRLGIGAFGAVYKGVWNVTENKKLAVAIKIPLEMTGPQASKDFLEEAYIMSSLDHPNLLSLLAVCMTSEMMFVTQLMPLGSLLDYIKANKDQTGSKALLNWSTQIARGMSYLEDRRLVHRDLAARNVLVHKASHVKITDFGLSKLLSHDSNEYKAAGGRMPIKWLALECIRYQIFTSKSDVWAFGVTIWELLTFGGRPYADHLAKDVSDLIAAGYKLAQPEICSLDVYIQLVGCWNLDAGLRPSFKDLIDVFSGFARDPGRYLYVPGDKYVRLPSLTNEDEMFPNLSTTFDTISETEKYIQPKQSFSYATDGFDTTPKGLPCCSDSMMVSSAASNNEFQYSGGKVCSDKLDIDNDYYMDIIG